MLLSIDTVFKHRIFFDRPQKLFVFMKYRSTSCSFSIVIAQTLPTVVVIRQLLSVCNKVVFDCDY